VVEPADGRDPLERLIGLILARFPAAPVMALRGDGQLTAIPGSLPVGGDRPRLSGTTVLDLVVAEDRAVVIDAWRRVLNGGTAQAAVRLADDRSRTVRLVFVDARARHGVLVSVALSDAADGDVTISDAPPPPPRFCRVSRDELGRWLSVDDDATRILGWSRDELLAFAPTELIHPEDADRAVSTWLELLGGGVTARRWRGRYRCKDGSWKWFETTHNNRLADPAHADVVSEMLDISDEMTAHETLRASVEVFRTLTDALPVGVLQVDRQLQVVFTNRQLVTTLEAKDASTFDALTAGIIDEDDARLVASVDLVMTVGTPIDLEIRLAPATPGDPERTCQASLRAVTKAGEVTGVIACFWDISDGVRRRQELVIQATVDGLTGCHNRASTLRYLDYLLDSHTSEAAGVVYIDLDRFKPVNDRYGHAAGDELLAAVASRLRTCVRRGDVVGRLGGDEFLVVYRGIDGPATLQTLADRITRTLNQPASVAGVTIDVRASVGAAIQVGAVTADQLVARADAAMFRAKGRGDGVPCLWEDTTIREAA
jgi:diguanylate cyclase (GGDEF)-like protein/PAS domain S-box-containing protein